MKFTNNSKKVIGIGGKYLLPGDSTVLTEEEAELGAISAYVRLGLGVVTNDKPARKPTTAKKDMNKEKDDAPTPTENSEAEDAMEMQQEAETEKQAAKRGRKKAE